MKKAFTLIELMVAISLVAILVSLAVVSIKKSQESGRDARRIADLESIRKALEFYKDANGRYPRSGGEDANGWDFSAEGAPWIDDGGAGEAKPLSPNFIDNLPVDPKNVGAGPSGGASGFGYVYAYYSNTYCNPVLGQEYILVAQLESKKEVINFYNTCNWNAAMGSIPLYALGEP